MMDSLSQLYGAFYEEGQKLRIDGGELAEGQLRRDRVPTELWPLIPYAEFWGIADDSYRIELISHAPADIWRAFRKVVADHKPMLLDWLAGPEAEAPPTSEYLAFSFLLQAFDWPRE